MIVYKILLSLGKLSKTVLVTLEEKKLFFFFLDDDNSCILPTQLNLKDNCYPYNENIYGHRKTIHTYMYVVHVITYSGT